jgi:hypothetical protein
MRKRHQLQRALLAAPAAGLIAASVIASPAYAAPPPSLKATISEQHSACTLTATMTWKNQTNVSSVEVFFLTGAGDSRDGATEQTTASSGSFSVTDTVQDLGTIDYWRAAGIVYGTPGGEAYSSKFIKLNCG